MDNNKSSTYDKKTMSNFVKDSFPNLAEFLEFLFLHYSIFAISEVFHFKSTSEEKVSKIMENNEISQAAVIDKLPGKFLKGGTEILSKPVFEICKLLICPEYFPIFARLKNSDLVSRKAKKLIHLITGLSRYCHQFQKSLKT